jgi:hypothetical protein
VTGWSKGYTLDLYSGSDRQGHRLFWPRFFVVLLSPQGKCRERNSTNPRPLPNLFKFITHLSPYYPILYSLDTESAVKQLKKKIYTNCGEEKFFPYRGCSLRLSPACRRPACAGGKIFEFVATATDVCVLRASDQFRLQELLYVQQLKIMATKRRVTIIL